MSRYRNPNPDPSSIGALIREYDQPGMSDEAVAKAVVIRLRAMGDFGWLLIRGLVKWKVADVRAQPERSVGRVTLPTSRPRLEVDPRDPNVRVWRNPVQDLAREQLRQWLGQRIKIDGQWYAAETLTANEWFKAAKELRSHAEDTLAHADRREAVGRTLRSLRARTIQDALKEEAA